MLRHIACIGMVMSLLRSAVAATTGVLSDSDLFAAISIVADADPEVRQTIGQVTKSAVNPLFVQDRPWEPRIDNGYPNVHRYGDGYRLFYGDCIKGCGTQVLLFANSTDGFTWDKPSLGIFDVTRVRPDLSHIGTKNNIIMQGGGIGVLHDTVHQDPPYKAFGQFATNGSVWSGTATSQDGFVWTRNQTLSFPSPQRYDCHNNVFFDRRSSTYVGTTRDGFSGSSGRDIGIFTAPEFAFDGSKAPRLVEQGDLDHQLYSQVTFRWLNIFLGIVMVYDANSKSEQVHCRLAWSRDVSSSHSWEWVDPAGLTGSDFIPLGAEGTFDSHICFAAAYPLKDASGRMRIYYMGGNGPHSGARNSSFAMATLPSPRHFAGLKVEAGRTGRVNTSALPCTRPTIYVTTQGANAATASDNGCVRVGVLAASHNGKPVPVPKTLSLDASIPVCGDQIDAPVRFSSGATLEALTGAQVTFQLELEGGIVLFAIGFVQ